MSDESNSLTSFTTPFGKFEFLRIPFSLKTAPRSFQTAVSSIFNDIDDVHIFLDDIIIVSNDIPSHKNTLFSVLKRLRNNNISINFKKSRFLTITAKFLGSIIEDVSIRADISNLNEAKFEVPPKTLKQLRSTIGYINWFRPYIPFLPHEIHFLNDKLKSKNIQFSTHEKELLKNLKLVIENQQTLYIPNFVDEFHLFTDSLNFAMGSILVQNNRIVILFSSKLTGAQLNYTIVEKELFAIIAGLTHFRNIINDT